VGDDLLGNIEEGRLYWTYLNRLSLPSNGIGKWKISSTVREHLYNVLRASIYEGALVSVSGIKMRTYPEKDPETIYAYTGPYTEVAIVQSVALEIAELIAQNGISAEKTFEYKTDLQTFWQKEAGVTVDQSGKPGEWDGKSWLYLYDGDEFKQNVEMLQMHYEIEKCGKSAESNFNELYRLLPKHLLSGTHEL
jgi:hypothetical protein